MTQTAKHVPASATPAAAPVVLFGMDQHGKPMAARFAHKHVALASKAAQQLKLQVLPITNPSMAEIVARLPAGRIHVSGKSFVPHVSRELYDKFLAASTAASPSDQTANSADTPKGSPAHNPGGGSKNDGNSRRPRNWDDIRPGHVVVAQESPTDGWYDAVVVERNGDMLSMRWNDYPRERKITRHRLSVALMFSADAAPARPDNATSAAKNSKKNPPKPPARDSSKAATSFPSSWDDIDVDQLVLAKDDGPCRSWWEAIPTEKTGESFVLRWRDFSQLSPVVRPRLSLALLHPKP